EVASELLTCLCERTVGYERFAIAYPYAGRRRHELQRVGGQILAVRLELMCELRRLGVTVLPLGVAPGLLVRVNQQHVFHSMPPSGSRAAYVQIDTSLRYLESSMPADATRIDQGAHHRKRSHQSLRSSSKRAKHKPSAYVSKLSEARPVSPGLGRLWRTWDLA